MPRAAAKVTKVVAASVRRDEEQLDKSQSGSPGGFLSAGDILQAAGLCVALAGSVKMGPAAVSCRL